MSKTKSTPIYGNWRMLAPDGDLMCRCDDKRARWYLSRGLAEEMPDKAFRLKFAPGGRGNAGDAFLLEAKENACVVCGSDHGLNRHHVVPYQYRKHMPLRHKSRASYDVVPICLEHHHEYEEKAQELADAIGAELGAPFNPSSPLPPERAALRKALAHARLLLERGDTGEIPEPRLARLREGVRAALGREPTPEALREFVEGVDFPREALSASHGSEVIRLLMERGGEPALREFASRWRRHFVQTMRPKNLSSKWDVDHAVA